jgi:hypothetical protein
MDVAWWVALAERRGYSSAEAKGMAADCASEPPTRKGSASLAAERHFYPVLAQIWHNHLADQAEPANASRSDTLTVPIRRERIAVAR